MSGGQEALIQRLKANGFGLGGSRRMAEKYPVQVVVSDATDWDFYCEESAERRQFLEQNGFHCIDAHDRTYWDDLLVDMYKHESLPIEVLIRKSASIYRSSFEALSAEVFVGRLWKSSPLANPDMCKGQFSLSVRDYFNTIFRLHGYQGTTPDDLIF